MECDTLNQAGLFLATGSCRISIRSLGVGVLTVSWKRFQKKISKMHYFSQFFKSVKSLVLNFRDFGRKTQIVVKFVREFSNFWWKFNRKLIFYYFGKIGGTFKCSSAHFRTLWLRYFLLPIALRTDSLFHNSHIFHWNITNLRCPFNHSDNVFNSLGLTVNYRMKNSMLVCFGDPRLNSRFQNLK